MAAGEETTGASSRPKVAVLKTEPETVIEDYGRLMRLAEYARFLPRDRETALKINISWHKFFPACSTTPWQLDGVINTMLEDGYEKEKILGCHNRTVVVSAKVGEVKNKHRNVVVDKYDLENVRSLDVLVLVLENDRRRRARLRVRRRTRRLSGALAVTPLGKT